MTTKYFFTLQYLKYCIFIIKAYIYGSAAYFEIFW